MYKPSSLLYLATNLSIPYENHGIIQVHFIMGLFRSLITLFSELQGVPKNSLNLGFHLISLAPNMLEVWYMLHLKGRINNMSMYDIIKTIRGISNFEQSGVLKTDTQYCFPYISDLPCCTELGVNLNHAYGCHLRHVPVRKQD